MGFFENSIIMKQIPILYTVKKTNVDANSVQKRELLQQVLQKMKILSFINHLKSSMHSPK